MPVRQGERDDPAAALGGDLGVRAAVRCVPGRAAAETPSTFQLIGRSAASDIVSHADRSRRRRSR